MPESVNSGYKIDNTYAFIIFTTKMMAENERMNEQTVPLNENVQRRNFITFCIINPTICKISTGILIALLLGACIILGVFINKNAPVSQAPMALNTSLQRLSSALASSVNGVVDDSQISNINNSRMF
jgi:hypothetical protein